MYPRLASNSLSSCLSLPSAWLVTILIMSLELLEMEWLISPMGAFGKN
jgi:hypothetical protein